MLITPMVPKVMASPIAASSSTEPSEMPYQTFCATSQAAIVWRIASAPAVAASLTSPSDDAAVACNTAKASRSPRSRTSAIASTFCAAGASEASTLAARASLIERLMRASFSPASAWSRAASEEASRRLKRASAAPRRTAGSGLINVSEPTAASMMPRNRLLTLTRSRSASDPLPAGLPEIASVKASWFPSVLPMSTRLSDLRT